MRQATLFDGRARAHSRAGDPIGSYRAGDKAHGPGGAAKRQRDAILVVVAQRPGLTSKAIARELEERANPMGRYAVARRLPELRKDGMVASEDGAEGELVWMATPVGRAWVMRIGG